MFPNALRTYLFICVNLVDVYAYAQCAMHIDINSHQFLQLLHTHNRAKHRTERFRKC